MAKETWRSRLGFIMAAAGSAVGLANIWRFPYLVGSHGGAAFIAVYLICLFLIGFPVFIAEVVIGRSTHKSPPAAFQELGKAKSWSWLGKMTILTGFIISSFYSAVAGWILGYLVEAVAGRITGFETSEQAALHYEALMANPLWGVSFHFLFMLASVGVLVLGVRKGIEKSNVIMMPMLFILLILLTINGLMLPNAAEGLRFLLTPNWSALTPVAIILALGQSFFTLSLGQGTMVTYGGYLSKGENIIKSCVPVMLMDTVVSLLAAIAVMTTVFSIGLAPTAGPGLIFQTLPVVFSQIPGGVLIAILFFLLVFLAALTSEISAMEPLIAYLQEKGWKRRPATLLCGAAAFVVGLPSALSFSVLKGWTLLGWTFFDVMNFTSTSVMVPLGGFAAVILVAWIWGIDNVISSLRQGGDELFIRYPWLASYFWLCMKFTAPLLIIFVFLHSLGLF